MQKQPMSLFIGAAVVLVTAACTSGTAATKAPSTAPPFTSSTLSPNPPQSPEPAVQRADLLAILASHHAAGEFVGARVAFLDRDGTITQAVAGRQGSGPGSPRVDLEAPWGIGSITKTHLAVVVLQLAEEGRLDLDAGISGSVPDLAGADLITPRDLLQHTFGLNDYTQPVVERQMQRAWTSAELVAVAEEAGRVGRPGGAYHYANTNYLVLGEIVEQVTGGSWLGAVRERIFAPLGMSESDLIGSDSPGGYDLEQAGFVEAPRDDPSTGGAAGALESTVPDLLRFAAALNNGTLLNAQSQAAMRSFVPGEDLSDLGVVHSYGLGLERYEVGALTVLGHLGVSDAHSAFVGFDPKSGRAVAVQINSTNGGPQALIAVEALMAAAQIHEAD